MVQLLQDNFFVTADADFNTTLPIVGVNGMRLVLDKKFDPYLHATRFGTIAEVPATFSQKSIDSHTLKKGDTVWFHHFVAQEKNKWMIKGEEFFQAHFEQIWAKVENDQLIPVEDYLFLSPIEETEEDVQFGAIQLRELGEVKKGVGICFAVSEYGKKMGINPGDKVHIIKSADYEVTIGENTLWRVRLQAVVCLEKDGHLIPLADKVIIAEEPRSDMAYSGNLVIPISLRSKDIYGKVIAVGAQIGCVVEGNEVCFLHGVFTKFEINGSPFAILRKENIIYIK